jgi:hypothetical protein
MTLPTRRVTETPAADPLVHPPTTPPPGDDMPLAERRAMQIKAKSSFVDIDEIYSADGLFAIICQHRSRGGFTFGIFRGFRRQDSDKWERTSFIPESHGESMARLAKLCMERIQKIRETGSAPFPERPA